VAAALVAATQSIEIAFLYEEFGPK
jgi:hypothetical protein